MICKYTYILLIIDVDLYLHMYFKVVRKMLQEASTIFSWEPEETDEGRLAIISAKELKDVELFLTTLE